MKRFLIIAAMLLGGSSIVVPNPIYIPPPQAFISELIFDASHNWTLELSVFIDQNLSVTGSIDSIVLVSNTSRARIDPFPEQHYTLFNITPAYLSVPFTINYQQDTIRLITYANSSAPVFPAVNTHMLVFGYPGSEIPVLSTGQSICSRDREHGNPQYFYLDNSPTPGVENDTTGASLTLSGKMYDVRGNMVTQPAYMHEFTLPVDADPCTYGYPPQSFICPLDVFTFDPQGNYSVTLLSRNSSVSVIRYLYWGPSNWVCSFSKNLPCTNFGFFIEPGGSYAQDIHLTDSSFLVGIPGSPAPALKMVSIVCAPVPLSHDGNFFISADDPVENAVIQVFSAAGALEMTLPVPPLRKSTVPFTRDRLGAAGLHFYRLMVDNHPVKSGEIICL